jgi:hypothetical protein
VGRNPPKNLPRDAHIKSFKKFAKKNPEKSAMIQAQALHQRLALKRAMEIEMKSLEIPTEDKIYAEIKDTEENIGRALDEDEISAITSSIILTEKKLRGKYKKSLPQVKKEFSKLSAGEQDKIIESLANEVIKDIKQEVLDEAEQLVANEYDPSLSSSSRLLPNYGLRSGINPLANIRRNRTPSVSIDSHTGQLHPSSSFSSSSFVPSVSINPNTGATISVNTSSYATPSEAFNVKFDDYGLD